MMKTVKWKSYGIWLVSVCLLTLFDQITKYMAITKLKGTDGISIIPKVFKLYYLENTGAAFGIMKNRQLLFIISTLIILVVLLYIYGRIPHKKRYTMMRILCITISAGAVGNLIDRIMRNFVVDFFYFELIDFPIFNVADIYVSVSAVVALLLFVFYYKEEDFHFLSPSVRSEK